MSRDTSENRKCEKCAYYVAPFKESTAGETYGIPVCEHPRVVKYPDAMGIDLARSQTARCRNDGFYWTPHRGS